MLDLNAIVADFDRMLRRLVGERIKVAINCEPALWRVRADPGEIGRAILNLALNARDAMPEGGTLTIGTANVTLTEADARMRELAPGRYVMMAVHDTGLGIDADVRAHIFEPFFTTKAVGKGTGLGLATVLGIVEQSGGVIRCESQMGEGTTFKISCPQSLKRWTRYALPAGGVARCPRAPKSFAGGGRRDRPRARAARSWKAAGTWFYEACNGREGLELCKPTGPIDLLVSDVVMPELGGRELAEARPQTPARHESHVHVRTHPGCRPQGGHPEGDRVSAKAFYARRARAKSARDPGFGRDDPQAIVSRGLWTGKFRIPRCSICISTPVNFR